MMYKIFAGENGIRKIFFLKEQIVKLKNQIEECKEVNFHLVKKIRRIKKDPGFIKRLIKEKMLFIEEDEVLYIIRGERKN